MAEEKSSTNPVWRITRWLLPVYTDEVGGQRVLVYTSFPKAFYFYLVWLPGFLVLGLNQMEVMSDTAVVWWMFGFSLLAYLVIAEDTGPMGFAVMAASVTTFWVLFSNGFFDIFGAQKLKSAAEEQWQETRVKAREYHTSAEDYIREHPTKSILIAAGVGFLFGLIVRR